MQKSDNNKQKTDSAVKVIVRVRPLISIEDNTSNIVSIAANEQSVTIYIDQYNQIETKFDKIVGENKTQKQMFSNIQPYINKILESFNLTIFAYGQTGSGKTYTMFGRDYENNFLEVSKKGSKQNTPLTDIASDDNYAGLIPRSAHWLFECLKQRQAQFNVFCSFLQIYNQKVYDLLQDSPIPNALSVHESKFQGIFVQGLGQFQVQEYTDCLQLMKRGEKNRFIRQTSMNAKSSRSHTIFQILLESTKSNDNGSYSRTRFNLCDLAGSERIHKSDMMANQHLEELKNINLSLTTLGKVINALSKGSVKNSSIFRQSKLTRLLQQSLMGNTNTFIVGAISPSSKNKDETLNTLKFVERAQHIKLSVKPSLISNQADIVQKLKQEMQQLRRILQEKQKQEIPKNIQHKLSQLEQENRKLKSQTDSKQKDIFTLAQENRKIKQALSRMEKMAFQQLSGASIQLSDDDSSLEDFKNKMKQSMKQNIKFNAFKPQHKVQLSSRYAADITNQQFLPPITQRRGSRLNKSLQSIPQQNTSTKASPLFNFKDKKRIINNLQLLETKQKIQQLKLLNSLQTIQQNERVKSEHVRGKSTSLVSQTPYSTQTLDPGNFKVKPKKKQDFSEKIKQLQSRLKKVKN